MGRSVTGAPARGRSAWPRRRGSFYLPVARRRRSSVKRRRLLLGRPLFYASTALLAVFILRRAARADGWLCLDYFKSLLVFERYRVKLSELRARMCSVAVGCRCSSRQLVQCRIHGHKIDVRKPKARRRGGGARVVFQLGRAAAERRGPCKPLEQILFCLR